MKWSAIVLLPLLVVGLAAGPLAAEEKADPAAGQEADAKPPVPPMASEDEADEALDRFKDDYRARGQKGDARTAARVWAIETLSKVQHPEVADELFKLARKRDPDISTAALIYLGNQRALSGYAGERVAEAMRRKDDDSTFLMAGLGSIVKLEYYGAIELLRELIKHNDYAVKKQALLAAADLKDVRLLDDVFVLLVEFKKDNGDSWDGVEVTYDTGTPGDHDQRMAEKIGKAKMAKNKAGARRARASSRDVGPILEEALKRLTGQEFETKKEATEWMKANEKQLAETRKVLDAQAEAQAEAADDL